ncbi:uncharacterized membrane protein YoaK (UPF0700 family) [Amorphus suaedae]
MNAVRMDRTDPPEWTIVLRQLGPALLLVALAGFVDAIGYLALSGLFVSFMSGNTTQMAALLASGGAAGAVSAALLIALFLAGVTGGAFLVEIAPRVAGAAILAGEAILMLGVAIASAGDDVSVAHLLPLAFAMGAQNNLRQAVAGTTLGSTFVTGSLVSTGLGLARHLSGKAGATAWSPHLASWTALVLGAVLGGFCFLKVGLSLALVGPAATAALLSVLHLRAALRRPETDGG